MLWAADRSSPSLRGRLEACRRQRHAQAPGTERGGGESGSEAWQKCLCAELEEGCNPQSSLFRRSDSFGRKSPRQE